MNSRLSGMACQLSPPIQLYFITATLLWLSRNLHLPAVLELPATTCTVQDVWPPSDVKFPRALTSWPIS